MILFTSMNVSVPQFSAFLGHEVNSERGIHSSDGYLIRNSFTRFEPLNHFSLSPLRKSLQTLPLMKLFKMPREMKFQFTFFKL